MRICKILGLGLMASALMAPVAYGKTYDAISQFSSVTNTDKQVWSYRYGSRVEGETNTYTLLPKVHKEKGWLDIDNHPYKLPQWYLKGPKGTILPGISGNTATVGDQGFNLHRDDGDGPVYLGGKSLVLNPGGTDGTHDVVLSFRAPKSGLVEVDYQFTDIDCHGGNGIAWYIDVDGASGHTTAASGTLDSDSNSCEPEQYDEIIDDAIVSLSKGDRLNLVVDSNGSDAQFDRTQVRATVRY